MVNRLKIDTVLVYGAGPMGLTMVQGVKRRINVKNVIVARMATDERLEKAKRSEGLLGD